MKDAPATLVVVQLTSTQGKVGAGVGMMWGGGIYGCPPFPDGLLWSRGTAHQQLATTNSFRRRDRGHKANFLECTK